MATINALTASHLENIHNRGLTDDTIEASQLKSVTAAQIKLIAGFNPTSGPDAKRLGLSGSCGIGIPFFHPLEQTLRLTRFRLDYPAEIGGKPVKYISPKGAGNILYFPPECREKLSDTSVPSIVTEGEFKALAAYQHGLFAVGLIGVWGWKTKGADGLSHVIPDFDLIEWKGRQVVIVFDSDIATNRHVLKARHELGKEIFRRGALAYSINLPPAADGSKQGLDDYLHSQGIEAFNSLDVIELPRTDIPPFTIGVSELLERPEPCLEWGIEGILPVGCNGFRIADPKAGKSWLMLSEAYSLATGKPLFNRFNVPKRRRVMVIEEEDNVRRVKRRMERIIHAHGGVRPPDVFFRISVKNGLRLDDPQWREVLEWEISEFRPDFVYLDVWNRLHSKDINSSEDMSEIILFLDGISREYSCAFIIIHHTRKVDAGGNSHNEIMGSRVLGGFSEATVFLRPTKEKGLIRVSVVLKDEPDGNVFEPEFQIKLLDTPDGLGTSIEYLGAPPEKANAIELREKIKQFVLSQNSPAKAKDVMDACKCSRPTALEHLHVLVDLKILERRIEGRTHTYQGVC